MQDKLWFKAKKYGWGWYPVSWQGWLITFLWIILFVTGSVIFERYFSGPEGFYYSVFVFVSVITLIYICYKKGERPGWHWGENN